VTNWLVCELPPWLARPPITVSAIQLWVVYEIHYQLLVYTLIKANKSGSKDHHSFELREAACDGACIFDWKTFVTKVMSSCFFRIASCSVSRFD
jgi:hypothetical protein